MFVFLVTHAMYNHRLRIFLLPKCHFPFLLVFEHIDFVKYWWNLNYFYMEHFLVKIARIIAIGIDCPMDIGTSTIEFDNGLTISACFSLIMMRLPLPKDDMASSKANINCRV